MGESESPSTGEPFRVQVKVVAQLRPGWFRVIIGEGIGLLDGGIEDDLPEKDIP